MRRFRSLLALALLALWLPVTLHCDLQAAGVLSTPECCTDEPSCSVEECEGGSGGSYQTSNAVLTVPAPQEARALFGMLELLSARSTLLPLRLTVAPTDDACERPLDSLTTWRFVRRAALPSRAPAFLLA